MASIDSRLTDLENARARQGRVIVIWEHDTDPGLYWLEDELLPLEEIYQRLCPLDSLIIFSYQDARA